jgi:hypothetical protein
MEMQLRACKAWKTKKVRKTEKEMSKGGIRDTLDAVKWKNT